MHHYMCIYIDLYPTGRRRPIGCLIIIGHFPQKSPIISGSSVKNDLQLKACCGSLPPCIYSTSNLYLIYIHQWPSSQWIPQDWTGAGNLLDSRSHTQTKEQTNKQTKSQNKHSAYDHVNRRPLITTSSPVCVCVCMCVCVCVCVCVCSCVCHVTNRRPLITTSSPDSIFASSDADRYLRNGPVVKQIQLW